MSSIQESLNMNDTLIIPSELFNIIEAVVDFYEQAKERLESSRLIEDLQINLRNWITHYYELDSLFDNMAYAYALTCHKAQGSSIDYVFLAVSDMHFCSDKQKILYTGLTRAKKRCYIT